MIFYQIFSIILLTSSPQVWLGWDDEPFEDSGTRIAMDPPFPSKSFVTVLFIFNFKIMYAPYPADTSLAVSWTVNAKLGGSAAAAAGGDMRRRRLEPAARLCSPGPRPSLLCSGRSKWRSLPLTRIASDRRRGRRRRSGRQVVRLKSPAYISASPLRCGFRSASPHPPPAPRLRHGPGEHNLNNPLLYPRRPPHRPGRSKIRFHSLPLPSLSAHPP